MGDLILFIRKADYTKLFIEPTNNTTVQAFRYLFVGGAAFLADWGILYLLVLYGLHYLAAAAFAFIVGLLVNFFISKKFIFTQDPEKMGRFSEFLSYGVIGLAGLLLTEIFMYLITDVGGLHFMLSKIIVAAIVLMWNFIARKKFIYN